MNLFLIEAELDYLVWTSGVDLDYPQVSVSGSFLCVCVRFGVHSGFSLSTERGRNGYEICCVGRRVGNGIMYTLTL